MADEAARSVKSIAYRCGTFAPQERTVPEETAIAISVNGSTHAVMMATPCDIQDLAIGLALNERIVASMAEIERIEIVDAALGVDCRLWLSEERAARYVRRRRQMAGPVGCGLCGAESLEVAAPELPKVSAGLRLSPEAIGEAVERMASGQVLGHRTRAVHAAGLHLPGEGMAALREDVGRHNALDKLAGHLAVHGPDPSAGFVTITSRVSVELIQKAAVMGVGLIAAISAPTALAVRTAGRAGITLVAVARGGDFELFTHAERVTGAKAQASRAL